MRSSAYLDATGRAVSAEVDGPSLAVRAGDDAPRRLPFARLAALVVRGPVQLAPEVLPALLRAGIAVTWQSADGRNLGAALPAIPLRSDLALLLDDAEARPDWPARLESWRIAEERLAVVRTIVRLGLPWHDLRARIVRRRLARLLDDRLGQGPLSGDELWARLHDLAAARVRVLLAADGVGARFSGRREGEADPIGAIVDLVAWSVWPIALELAAYLRDHALKHRDEPRLQRRLVARIEGRAAMLDRATDRVVASLRRALRQFLL